MFESALIQQIQKDVFIIKSIADRYLKKLIIS